MLRLAAAVVAAWLSACQSPVTWTKEGATRQDFDTDLFNCEKQRHESGLSRYSTFGLRRDPYSPLVLRDRYLKNCMAARGWSPAQASE
jgi:hypothetical protein